MNKGLDFVSGTWHYVGCCRVVLFVIIQSICALQKGAAKYSLSRLDQIAGSGDSFGASR